MQGSRANKECKRGNSDGGMVDRNKYKKGGSNTYASGGSMDDVMGSSPSPRKNSMRSPRNSGWIDRGNPRLAVMKQNIRKKQISGSEGQ